MSVVKQHNAAFTVLLAVYWIDGLGSHLSCSESILVLCWVHAYPAA